MEAPEAPEAPAPDALPETPAPTARTPGLQRVPLSVILRASLDRPWLALYRVRPLTNATEAERIAAEHRTLALAAGEEVWVKICASLGFLDLGRIACVCSLLQRVAASPALWESKCVRAWRYSGFVRPEDVLHAYGWSWRRMFLRRPRLRTDGVYYLEVTSYTRGMDEGTGMKELGHNSYRGKYVETRWFRYLRFLADGRLLTCTTWRPPSTAVALFGRATQARSAADPAVRRIGAAIFGGYEVLSDDARDCVRLRAQAEVRLVQYPQARCSTVHYELALSACAVGASNARLAILSHYSSYLADGSDVVEHAIPKPGYFEFLSFDCARRTANQLTGVAAPTPMADAAVDQAPLGASATTNAVLAAA